jgi:hypothetical protein
MAMKITFSRRIQRLNILLHLFHIPDLKFGGLVHGAKKCIGSTSIREISLQEVVRNTDNTAEHRSKLNSDPDRTGRSCSAICYRADHQRPETGSLAPELHRVSLDYVQVSLESHLPEVHDKMVGVRGAWQETRDGILSALKNNLAVITNTTLTRDNLNQFPETIQAGAALGLKMMACNTLICSGRGTCIKKEADVSPEDLKTTLSRALEIAQKVSSIIFDKTGTLTLGKPSVTDVITYGKYDADTILTFAASVEKGSEHPLAEAIEREASSRSLKLLDPVDFEAIPGKGVKAEIKDVVIMLGNRKLTTELNIDLSKVENTSI